jgi:Mycoplasma protein of unknown function, DUF285
MQFFGASSFQSDLSLWNIDKVEDMGSMFERASSFSSNLYNWGNRLAVVGSSTTNVNVEDMFTDSACPEDSDPMNIEEGPWCTESATAVVVSELSQ